MTRNNDIALAVRRALLVGALTATGLGILPAQAQDQNAANAANTVTTVMVTGSRIPQPRLEAASPVTTVNSESFKQSGATRVEDLLDSLPQVMSDFGAGIANGATGEATVSLRGLGANRTLVLVNGRRLMPGDPTQNGNEAPDLNQIPAALIERVDILTGGASAVYGADAVAGVINFVMNDHFQGVRVDADYSFYQHHNHDDAIQEIVRASNFDLPDSSVADGATRDLSIVVGSDFADGRGNATAYAGYRRIAAVTQAARDFSACTVTSTQGMVTCGGSSSAYPGRFNVDGTNYQIGPNRTLVPFSTLYNFAPLSYFQRPDERYTLGSFVHYDINDHARAYMSLMFMDDRTQAQIAPSGAFYGSGTGVNVASGIPDASWLVNCNNPLLSADEQAVFCASPDVNGNAHILIGRRNVEGGPRFDDLTHTSFRTVVGLKGAITDDWTYDIYAQNGITRLSEEYFNDVSKTRLARAFQVVTDPTTGQPVCKSALDGTDPNCVPYDIFSLNGVTQAAVDYIGVPGISKGSTTERIVNGSVTGDLTDRVKLPTANHGLGVNFGFEYREEKSELHPDLEFITGDLAGQGAATLPTMGAFHVWNFFGEARLPILENQPFAKSLTTDVGYRYSKYTLSFGSTNTYKFGVQWAPIQDIRFRGMYQRAVRAPNIQELFLQPRVQLDGVTDPCSGTTPDATLAQCENSGVTPAEYGNIAPSTASQYNGLVGGNPNLAPEKADTYTVGLVFTPSALPAFNLTLDYYNIKITNFITSYGADFILKQCLDSANPFYCGKVHRVQGTQSAADGSLWIGTSGYIEDGTYNLGSQRASGVDISSQYTLDLGRFGGLRLTFDGSYTLKFATEPVPGLGSYDCVGYYGATCQVPDPHWRHKLRAVWRTPVTALSAWLNWRHIGGVTVENVSSNPLLSSYTDMPGTHLGHRDYIDLGASYTLASSYTVRVGVNNLFDKDPPLSALGYLPAVYGNGNTFPQTYDSLGRYIFVNVTLDF